MTERELGIRVQAALRPYAGGKRAEQVIKWLETRHFRLEADYNLAEIDWKSADKSDIGRKIYDFFCEVTHHKAAHAPENVAIVLGRLAGKFADADAEALEERDYSLSEQLQSLVNNYVWRDDYLRCQTLDAKDLEYAANTIWAKNISPQLSDEDKAEIETRRAAKSPVRDYDKGELKHLIRKFLQKNRRFAFTNNQVKDEFHCEYKLASALLESLVRHGSEIIKYKIFWVNAKGEKQPKKLFKFAPERKTMDFDGSRSQEIVTGVIVRFVAAHPSETKRAIRAAMREYFGHIDDKIVDQALASLVADGEISVKIGKQRAHLHTVSGLVEASH
ncbi:MAG: hypothetical protein ACRYFS_21960 [Janthinobacterium lividum]